MTSNKLQTGINKLDEILDGGIPEGHIILVSGASGTGKTILGLQYLFKGAELGEGGIYISHTEEEDSIIQNLEVMDFYRKEHVKKGLVRVVDCKNFPDLSNIDSTTLDGAIGMIDEMIGPGTKRIVIDSITSICDTFGENRFPMRKFIYGLRTSLRARGMTALILSEVPPLTVQYSKYGMEEFISDGIILLQDVSGVKQMKRSLVVMKMRGVNHSREYHAVVIKEDGITLESLFLSG